MHGKRLLVFLLSVVINLFNLLVLAQKVLPTVDTEQGGVTLSLIHI